jgi:hypothetical protein
LPAIVVELIAPEFPDFSCLRTIVCWFSDLCGRSLFGFGQRRHLDAADFLIIAKRFERSVSRRSWQKTAGIFRRALRRRREFL